METVGRLMIVEQLRVAIFNQKRNVEVAKSKLYDEERNLLALEHQLKELENDTE